MSLEFDVLSVGYHHPDYWTIWVGRLDVGGGTNGGVSLFQIGLRGRHAGMVRVVFDVLWLSWVVHKLRTWLHRREYDRMRAKAVKVGQTCMCGHDASEHEEMYFMGGCYECGCSEYRPLPLPLCTCGHTAGGHVYLGPGLRGSCAVDECECDSYRPMDAHEVLDLMVRGLLDELD